MFRLRIVPYQGTNQGEVIALENDSEESFKFIGELDGNKAKMGAVFEIVTSEEKLLVWNGVIEENKVEKFFRKSILQDKIFRKLQDTKMKALARPISSSDRFVFTNSDVVLVGGDVFSFEGILTSREGERKVLPVKGKMIVQGNNVLEVSEVEVDKNEE